jgi:hypothetical protein
MGRRDLILARHSFDRGARGVLKALEFFCSNVRGQRGAHNNPPGGPSSPGASSSSAVALTVKAPRLPLGI